MDIDTQRGLSYRSREEADRAAVIRGSKNLNQYRILYNRQCDYLEICLWRRFLKA